MPQWRVQYHGSWGALPAESLFVRAMVGREGQSISIRAAVRGDSLQGYAIEVIAPARADTLSVRGVRTLCSA